jgi:hypothetical protein
LNRKVLASAMTVGVLSAPVAIAVADTNDTNDNQITPAPTAKVIGKTHETAATKRDHYKEAIQRDRKERKKAAERKRAKKRAKARALKQGAAAPQAQAGGGSPQQASGGSTAPGNLQAIAACESGGNPGAVGGGGAYGGKYQFDQQTWESVGGAGDPAAAPEAEQDARAQALLAQSGSAAWPVCGS